MHFQDAYELVRVFGPRATARTLSKATGISARTLARLATESGITLRTSIEPITGIEHLPGLPNFTDSHAWRGGTVHRIDLSKAGDSPGYRSLLIHQSGVQGQDDEDDNDD